MLKSPLELDILTMTGVYSFGRVCLQHGITKPRLNHGRMWWKTLCTMTSLRDVNCRWKLLCREIRPLYGINSEHVSLGNKTLGFSKNDAIARRLSVTAIVKPPLSHCGHCLAVHRGVGCGHIRLFRTTPRAYVPPFLWIFVQPVAKLAAIFSGRFFRKWWKTLPHDRRIFARENLKKNWYWFVLAGVSLSGLVYGYYRSHLQETPVTNRARFIVVTDDQFVKIAEYNAKTILEKYADELLLASHPYYKLVVEITRRLVSCNQDFPKMKGRTWQVNVIDGDERNAFVLPTGDIFVFRGLIETTGNEDQLAVVIGHEMAHALLSHAAEQLSYMQLVDWMIIAVMAAIWAIMPNDGIAVISQWFYHKVVEFSLHLPYSRKLEKEADKVGIQLCAKACFDVRESSAFWTVMDCLSRLEEGNIPEWLSTHPSNENRVKHLDFIMPKVIEERAACSCPPLPSVDPRDRLKPTVQMTDSVVRAMKAGVNLKQVHVIKPRSPQSA